MIDIGLTNALAQIRDALYEISDTLKEVKETEDIVNKCENCPYKPIMNKDTFKVRNGRNIKRRVDDLINAVYNIITKSKGDI